MSYKTEHTCFPFIGGSYWTVKQRCTPFLLLLNEYEHEHALQGCPVLIAPFTGSASAGGSSRGAKAHAMHAGGKA